MDLIPRIIPHGHNFMDRACAPFVWTAVLPLFVVCAEIDQNGQQTHEGR